MAQARARDPDPTNQLRGLVARVAQEGLPRAALVRGEEHYFVERALEVLLAAATQAGLEICRHDVADPEFEPARLLDDLGASPMFASARLVLVRNADAARRGDGILKKQGAQNSAFTRAALSLLESERPGALVISGRSIRADHALAKAVQKLGAPLLSLRKLYDTPPPWSPDPRKVELALWVGTRSRELGLRLSPDDCAYLALATGNDLSAIDTQLEKLRRGGRASLREVVGWQSGGTPWKAADELLGGDLARALAAVEALFRGGFHSDRDGKTEVSPAALSAILLATLRSRARQALVGSRALARGASPAQAATEAGVSNQKAARESFEALLKLRGAASWERVHGELLETERKSRTGAELDANDFFPLALRWRVDAGRKGVAREAQPRARR
jgi:DNA polymerase III delta subunit